MRRGQLRAQGLLLDSEDCSLVVVGMHIIKSLDVSCEVLPIGLAVSVPLKFVICNCVKLAVWILIVGMN